MNEQLRARVAQGYRLTSGELAVSTGIDRALTAGAPSGLSINARILGPNGITIRVASWYNTAADEQGDGHRDRPAAEPAVRRLETAPLLLSALPAELDIQVWSRQVTHHRAEDWLLRLHFTNDTGARLTWQGRAAPDAFGPGWAAPLAAGLTPDTPHESFARAASH